MAKSSTGLKVSSIFQSPGMAAVSFLPLSCVLFPGIWGRWEGRYVFGQAAGLSKLGIIPLHRWENCAAGPERTCGGLLLSRLESAHLMAQPPHSVLWREGSFPVFPRGSHTPQLEMLLNFPSSCLHLLSSKITHVNHFLFFSF